MRLISLGLIASMLAIAADPKPAPKPTVVLNAEDREPAHLAIESVLSLQVQLLQLQAQLAEAQKRAQAALITLKTKCGGDLTTDLQCASGDKK